MIRCGMVAVGMDIAGVILTSTTDISFVTG